MGEILGGGVGLKRDSWELMRRVSHESVVRAATWDLLFSESDRHAENVFIREGSAGAASGGGGKGKGNGNGSAAGNVGDGEGEARLTLIDNEGSFDERKGISTACPSIRPHSCYASLIRHCFDPLACQCPNRTE